MRHATEILDECLLCIFAPIAFAHLWAFLRYILIIHKEHGMFEVAKRWDSCPINSFIRCG